MMSFRAKDPAWRGAIKGQVMIARPGGDGSMCRNHFLNQPYGRIAPPISSATGNDLAQCGFP
jgi:hypothetical protein